jgi:hypothetical protein
VLNRIQQDAEEELRAAFAAFDTQGRGGIPTRDLRRALTTRGEPLTKQAPPFRESGRGRVDRVDRVDRWQEMDAMVEASGGGHTIHFDELTSIMLGLRR